MRAELSATVRKRTAEKEELQGELARLEVERQKFELERTELDRRLQDLKRQAENQDSIYKERERMLQQEVEREREDRQKTERELELERQEREQREVELKLERERGRGRERELERQMRGSEDNGRSRPRLGDSAPLGGSVYVGVGAAGRSAVRSRRPRGRRRTPNTALPLRTASLRQSPALNGNMRRISIKQLKEEMKGLE